MENPRLSPEDYKIGWICALPLEMEAAAEMLDETHANLPHDPDHTNLYILGRIGDHNIAIVCLPAGQTGKSSASAVVVQMKAKFTAMIYFLMVGIGGGVPSSEADIRRGDVVVSQPNGAHGGVFQYDFGKSTPQGFVRKGHLNRPPALLLSALAVAQARKKLVLENLSKTLIRFESLRRASQPDLLFKSSYQHAGGPDCSKCCIKEAVIRQPREGQRIKVHFGTIASGDQVIGDGELRDRISSENDGILCYEMEAAGLMNNSPCLVIRGISDYADSHKDDSWQEYAAIAAAAYAREFLSFIPGATSGGIQSRKADWRFNKLNTMDDNKLYRSMLGSVSNGSLS